MPVDEVPRRALTRPEKQVLCSLADPLAPCPAPERINRCDPFTLFDALAHHRIEPIAIRKLKSCVIELDRGFAEGIARLDEQQFIANAMTMALENYARKIFAGLNEQSGVRKFSGVIVKGPVFAKELFAHLSDRPFTDIDILVPMDGLDQVGELLKKLGYHQSIKKVWDKSEANREQKWLRKDAVSILVEVHTNLVHYTRLRNRLSFGYEEFMQVSGGGEFPAVANFITAVVHAAAGHKFHEMRLMVDVLQAFRHLQSRDLEFLSKALEVVPARMEVLMCLDLIEDLFENVSTRDAIRQLSGGSRFAVARKLVNADAVLDTYCDRWHLSRLRRHAFRFCQNRFER